MGHGTMRARSRADIELVEHVGYRYRRYIDALDADAEHDRSYSRGAGFGALRLFDDVTVDPGAHVSALAHDGFETVLYVLGGECVIEDDRGHATPLGRGGAAAMLLGHGIRHTLRNPSSTTTLRALVVAVVAPVSNPAPRLTAGPFRDDTSGLVWVATHGGEEQVEEAVVGPTVRLGIGTLSPGVELGFPRAVGRGLFVDVLEGKIELGAGFVDEGGDARVSLESPARLQAITRARIVVADVAMGYAQQLV
jgi:redox-sensitive bicupin YhaK (pirin superfamily)